jgi:hypothetical protein
MSIRTESVVAVVWKSLTPDSKYNRIRSIAFRASHVWSKGHLETKQHPPDLPNQTATMGQIIDQIPALRDEGVCDAVHTL